MNCCSEIIFLTFCFCFRNVLLFSYKLWFLDVAFDCLDFNVLVNIYSAWSLCFETSLMQWRMYISWTVLSKLTQKRKNSFGTEIWHAHPHFVKPTAFHCCSSKTANEGCFCVCACARMGACLCMTDQYPSIDRLYSRYIRKTLAPEKRYYYALNLDTGF